MIYPTLYHNVVWPALAADAIENNDYVGFREDYLVLHCLIKVYKPKTFLEIGTHEGRGTEIICNAGKSYGMKVYSMDLPAELSHQSKQYPAGEGKVPVGSKCKLPFTQVLADSLRFDYRTLLPIEGFFIDGEHDYTHALNESMIAFDCKPELIVWHDADMSEVWKGIEDAFSGTAHYNLYRVVNTRIAYAVRLV